MTAAPPGPAPSRRYTCPFRFFCRRCTAAGRAGPGHTCAHARTAGWFSTSAPVTGSATHLATGPLPTNGEPAKVFHRGHGLRGLPLRQAPLAGPAQPVDDREQPETVDEV